MDSALAVFLCLAAVASIAYCQTPTCPPELQTPTLDPIYRRDSYVNPRELIRLRCLYTRRLAYNGAPFGIPRLLRRTYYVCREGMPQPLGLPGLGQQLYTCSDPVQIEVPDDEPVDVEVPDAFPIEVQPIPDDSTSGDDSAISPETVRPPTPAPSTKPENPTETENDRMSCQRGFATSNYLYSSLGLIVPKSCFTRIASQGASLGSVKSTMWFCKDGYTREHVRRSQYRCVKE